MKCSEWQDEILDSIGKQRNESLQHHISNCNECRQFAGIQEILHERLMSASSVQLSPNFRIALRTRLARERTFVWPDYLPDIAHLLGGVIATAVSVLVLPWPALPVLIAGTALTGATYLFQSTLRDALYEEH
jgi:hypothetical protein